MALSAEFPVGADIIEAIVATLENGLVLDLIRACVFMQKKMPF
jgi:hypothetical protein